MFKKMFFLLLLPICIFAGKIDPSTVRSFSHGEVPEWVNLFEYDLNPPATAEQVKEGYQQILKDEQENWEDKVSFERKAFKILSKKGAKNENEFDIYFDTSFQALAVHSIRVYRAGVWLDYTQNATLKMYADDEDEIDRDDEILVEYDLKDLQVGDVVEYQYSKKGISSFLSKYFNKKISVSNWNTPILFSYRLLASPEHILSTRSYDTNETVTIKDLSSSFREWSVQFTSLKPRTWKDPRPRIVLSEYPTWKAVIDELLPLVNISDEFVSNPSDEAQQLVREWMDQSTDPAERACLAVRFIQDEFESYTSSIKSCKPTNLNIVLENRNGNIHAKTLLLKGLLKMMGIPSTPVLTAKYGKDKFIDGQPVHKFFNSMVLSIDFDGTSFYVDPSAEDQKGPLDSNLLSDSYDYKIGLPLSQGSSELISFPLSQPKQPTKIITSILPLDSSHFQIRTETVYYGNKANELRKRLKEGYTSIEELSKQKTSSLAIYHTDIEIIEPFQLIDNEHLNTVKTIELYKARARYSNVKISPEIFSQFYSFSINPKSQTPHSLQFPLWIQQEIHIECPDSNDKGTNRISDNLTLQDDSVSYRQIVKKSDQSTDYFFEMKYLQKEVKPEQVDSYNKIMAKISNQLYIYFSL